MSQAGSHLRNLLLRNARLKLVSLLLAFLLWVALNDEPKSEIGLSVPLEFLNVPKGVEVLGEAVNSVDVRLSARSSLVRRIDPSNVTATVDLSAWTLGERTYSLSDTNIHAPLGVTVTKITPSKIRLRFEATQRKIVDIHPRVVGIPASGFRVSKVVCDPAKVQMEGPSSHLDVVDFVSTDSLDISGLNSTVSRRIHIYVEDPLVRLIDYQETRATVVIEPLSAGSRETQTRD